MLLALLLLSVILCLPQSSTAFVVSPSSLRSPSNSNLRPSSRCAVPSPDHAAPETLVDMSDVGFIVLAGGKGSRMKATMPKQFLDLCGVPVLHHSLAMFLEYLPAYLMERSCKPSPYIVLVLDPSYHADYEPLVDRLGGCLALASPGVERQGSVENGLAKLVEMSDKKCKYAAIHDSARPLVTVQEVCNVVKDAKQFGAAVLGVPCKATIKESEDGQTVLRTIPRARLWEVHTPQVVRIDTLQRGFAKVAAENLEVTDDVSIVEALGETVKLTLGEYTNLKITTPEDMDVAAAILQDRGTDVPNMFFDDEPVYEPPVETIQDSFNVIGEPEVRRPQPQRNWYEGTRSSMRPDAMRKIDISRF